MDGGGKIKLFKFIRKTYQDIGLNSPKSNQNRSPINTKNWILLFCLAQYFGSTAAYLLFEANSTTEYGLSFFTCILIALATIAYLISLWQMKNNSNFIENCELFVEKRTHSTILYKNTNEKIERLTEYNAYVLIVCAMFVMLPPLLYTIVNYYVLDTGKESFFLFFLTWLPFDWKTPLGYLGAWFAQCAGIASIIMSAISFFNIVFGSNWLFIVIAEDITNDVAAFNNTVGTSKDGSDRAELMERFCDIVQYYSDAKQCVSDFDEVFKYALFAFFSWDMLSISSLLVTLQFQLWDEDSQPIEIMILSAMLLWTFVYNLAICEPGERVTKQFEEFGAEFGRCEWNKLPLEMQRIYLIFLSDTQQPQNIRSYGGILCTRDTFKQITNKGFSYFMTLRNLRG